MPKEILEKAVIELVRTEYKKEIYEDFRHTTNNRMELLGVIIGLEI